MLLRYPNKLVSTTTEVFLVPFSFNTGLTSPQQALVAPKRTGFESWGGYIKGSLELIQARVHERLACGPVAAEV